MRKFWRWVGRISHLAFILWGGWGKLIVASLFYSQSVGFSWNDVWHYHVNIYLEIYLCWYFQNHWMNTSFQECERILEIWGHWISRTNSPNSFLVLLEILWVAEFSIYLSDKSCVSHRISCVFSEKSMRVAEILRA